MTRTRPCLSAWCGMFKYLYSRCGPWWMVSLGSTLTFWWCPNPGPILLLLIKPSRNHKSLLHSYTLHPIHKLCSSLVSVMHQRSICSKHKLPKKVFAIRKLPACCAAAPDPSQNHKFLFVLAVKCKVYICTEQTGRKASLCEGCFTIQNHTELDCHCGQLPYICLMLCHSSWQIMSWRSDVVSAEEHQ